MTKLSPGGKNIQEPFLVDINGQPITTNASIISPIDQHSEAVEIIDYAHHEVHEGDHFTFSAFDGDIDIGEVLEFILVAPVSSRWSHMVGSVSGALHTEFRMFEDTTHTTNVQQLVYNNNRNSENEPGTEVHTSNDDVADGTLIFSTSFGVDTGVGSNKKSGGGDARADSEWILKSGAKYLFRITSLSDANNVSLVLSWYEHINSL